MNNTIRPFHVRLKDMMSQSEMNKFISDVIKELAEINDRLDDIEKALEEAHVK